MRARYELIDAEKAHHPAVTIDEVRSRTGFHFDAAGAAPAAPLTPREAEALRSLDPDGRFEADVGVSLG